jgi:HEAT repeat protein
MKKLITISLALLVILFVTSEVMGHGGTWRGSRKPGYTTPPPAKYPDTPQGPKYPTPPTRPTTPPSTPPTTPGTPPTTPPTAPPTAPPTGPQGPASPGKAGPTNTGPTRTGAGPTSGPGPNSPVGPSVKAPPTRKPVRTESKGAASNTDNNWDTWWEHNKHIFINVKKSNNKANVSGDDTGKKEEGKDVWVDRMKEVMAKEFHYDPRTSAAIALGKIASSDNKQAFQVLVDGTEDQELQVRESSILALGLLGNKEAIPRLIKILESSDKKEVTERFFAAISLGLIGDESAVPVFEKIIKNTKDKLKEIKVGVLLAYGLMKNEKHIEYLVKIAKSPKFDDEIRATAVTAIAKVGSFEFAEKGKKINAAKDFMKLMGDKKTPKIIRRSIVNAFCEIGDPKFYDEVADMYEKEKDHLAKGFFVIAMAQLAKKGDARAQKDVIKVLEKDIAKGSYNVRGFCAIALGLLKDRKATKILQERFKSVKDPLIKSSVCIGLGLLGDKSVVPDLVEEISPNSRSTDDVQAYAALALGMIHQNDDTPDPSIVDALLKAIDEGKKKPNLLRQSCIALALMNARQQGIKAMLKILEDEDSSVFEKGAAAQALGMFKDTSVVETLWKTYKAEFDSGKRRNEYRAFLLIPIGAIKSKTDISPMAKIAENFNYTIDFKSISELFDIL